VKKSSRRTIPLFFTGSEVYLRRGMESSDQPPSSLIDSTAVSSTLNHFVPLTPELLSVRSSHQSTSAARTLSGSLSSSWG